VEVQKPTNLLAERAARQLERYRDHPDVRFELPLLIEGSEVSAAAMGMSCAPSRAAKTLTYGELAQRLGAEARAVGQACGDNRLPDRDSLPSRGRGERHRRLAHATDGYLLEAKRWLLLHECGADAFRADTLDAFCDALWLEDGLAQNTIAAYRADLEQLQAFLRGALLKADEEALFASSPRRRAAPPAPRAASRASSASISTACANG